MAPGSSEFHIFHLALLLSITFCGQVWYLQIPHSMYFQSKSHWIERLFRVCGRCGRSLIDGKFFCSSCWDFALSKKNQGAHLRQDVLDTEVYALWTWDQETDSFLKPLIYALKGGWNPLLSGFLANLMVLSRASLPLRRKDFLVTLPPRHLDLKDHAYLLAAAFSAMTKQHLWDDLGRFDDREGLSQKSKNLRDRRKLQFYCKNLPKEWNKFAPSFLFVDDVVTSGATLRAAHLALGSPIDFEVWCLAYRKPAPKIAG